MAALTEETGDPVGDVRDGNGELYVPVAQVAEGTSGTGKSRAAEAGAYPEQMCLAYAQANRAAWLHGSRPERIHLEPMKLSTLQHDIACKPPLLRATAHAEPLAVSRVVVRQSCIFHCFFLWGRPHTKRDIIEKHKNFEIF